MALRLKSAAIALAATVLVSAGAYAATTGSWCYSYEYYSNASKTEQVGSGFLSCGGVLTVSGVKTPYYYRVPEAPCSGGAR